MVNSSSFRQQKLIKYVSSVIRIMSLMIIYYSSLHVYIEGRLDSNNLIGKQSIIILENKA